MNEQPKICPLLSVGRADDPALCVGDRCAWWHEVRGSSGAVRVFDCAITSLADSMDDMNVHGIAICD